MTDTLIPHDGIFSIYVVNERRSPVLFFLTKFGVPDLVWP